MRPFLLILLVWICCHGASGQQTVGLFTQSPAQEDGYVLFSPMFGKDIYLIDKCGRKVHSWNSKYQPGVSVYLLPDGTLLRPGNVGNKTFSYAGSGGLIEQLDWNSNVTWSYNISSAIECQHHDICRMPNGNILAIVWVLKSDIEATSMGRDPLKTSATVWSEKVIELKPTGTDSAEIIWEWRVWDHLVQQFDPSRPNWGQVSEHPELIDINYAAKNANPDWLHLNSISYNAELDQIMLSSYYFNEFWVIDHSTDRVEANMHTGGRCGKGGDLLYRWGNAEAYGRGNAPDRKFYAQHDAHWIPKGFRDGGKIMVYNNGNGRPEGSFSSVEVIDPPLDSFGNYTIMAGNAYEPERASWIYMGRPPLDFYSPIISGAARLSNGNTLITEGTKGILFEVDTSGNTVWKYVSPVGAGGTIVSQGTDPTQPYIFRCYQYPPTYPGFLGHILAPGAPIESSPLSYSCLSPTTPTQIAGNEVQANIAVTAGNPFNNNIVLSGITAGKMIQADLLNSMGMHCGHWDIQPTKDGHAALQVPDNLAAGIYLFKIRDSRQQTTIKLVHE